MRKRDNIGFVNSNTIYSLSIPVTEKISSRNLTQFIKTNISNKNIDIDHNTFYYFQYLDSSKSYEIVVFNDCNIENFIFEPFLILGYYYENNIKNRNDIFITQNYFALFINQEFIIYRNIKNETIEDISIYVSQTYNISIDNFINISEKEITIFRKNYFLYLHNNIDFNYQTFNKIDSFKIFQIYLLVATLIFGYILYKKVSPNQKVIIVKPKQNISNKTIKLLKKRYMKHKNNKIIKNSVTLFKYLKINHIKIETINIKKDIAYTTLISEDKRRLYNILTIYNNTKVKSINFNKKKSIYSMVVEIRL